MAGILFVHGAWHDPRCWENLSTHLAECGHEVRRCNRVIGRPPGSGTAYAIMSKM